MTINEIFLKDEISVRAFNTCTDNEIDTISELKEYFNTFGSFKHFRNCGRKTDSELTTICYKYFDFQEGSKDFLDQYSNQNVLKIITQLNKNKISIIDRFIELKAVELSMRSSNALKRFLQDCITVESLLVKVFKNVNFNVSQINNLGEKSIPEVSQFLKDINIFIIDYLDKNQTDIEKDFNLKSGPKIKEIISNLNRQQRQIINSHIKFLSKNLSVRSNNAFCLFLNSEPSLFVLNDKVFSQVNFDTASIPNIGKRSIPEINQFMDEIKRFITEVSYKNDDEDLKSLELNALLNARFKNFNNDFLRSSNNHIFSLINILINEDFIFTNTESIIFKRTFNLYVDSTYIKFSKIGEVVKYTSERVRQIRVLIHSKLYSQFEFIKNVDRKYFTKYNIDINHISVIIDDDTAKAINTLDNTNFSKQFLTLIFSIILEDQFVLIGNTDDTLILKDSNARYRHNWQNIYLIKKEIIENFNIDEFIKDIDSRANERNEETYKFNFKSYLTRFLKKDDYTIINEILSTCEKILFEEFNLFLSTNEDIVFERNTIKTLSEYAFEALEILGKPSHISEINEQIKILKPDYENEIKNTTLNRKFGFISFGRTSTFGLKKWEVASDNIRGGTIRGIVEEFLLKYDVPKHLSEIAEYVLKYRPETNEKSIIYNLKLEDNNRFLFFKKSFIGLKSKKYDDHELELLDEGDIVKKKTWDENYHELIKFIKKNNRLPSSINCPLDEIKINRWLNVQRSKINRGILEEDKIDKINQVVSSYNVRVNKTTLFRNEGYEKLAQFIIKEKRLPSANKTDESQLYAFFYKQRKLFEEGTLEPQEETKFIDIAKLIQNK